MQIFKIFLASSSELQDDRQKFQLYLDNRNKSWIKKGVAIELVHWEDFIDAVSKTRLQDEYDKAICDCDLFLMLFFTKVGMYTDEEFETAYESFKKTGKPLIYTFFKDASITTGTANKKDLMSLWSFQDKLKDLGHFKTTYTNTEDFLLQFDLQLDKLADHGFIKLNPVVEDASVKDRKIRHHLTQPPLIPPIFEGRDDDLEAVHRKLFDENHRLLLLNGEGGIGKTTLAAMYWQRYEAEYKYTAWLFAQKNLLDALLSLASPLHVEFSDNLSEPERFDKLMAEMANLDSPCLLIIDNANDVGELEKHYPALHSCLNFHILLTTRINRFELAEIYHIKPLQVEDALTVFGKNYPKHKAEEDDLLKTIFSAVGGNTLVLELLAKNLAAINTDEIFYSLSDLLQDLQKNGLLELSQAEAVSIPEKGNHKALKKAKPTAIIEALYDEMEMVTPLTDAEQSLLSNFAVLPAENLSYTLLKALLTPTEAKTFSHDLTSLAQRGWIEKSEQNDGSSYKISPVVQEITRHKNKASLLFHCGKLIYNLIEKLKYQPGIGHFLNATYQEAELYSHYAENLVGHFDEIDYNLSLLCDSIGYYHRTTGNLNKALMFFNEYNRQSRQLFDENPYRDDYKNSLAISCVRLGNTLLSLGDLQQTLIYYQEYNRLGKELFDTYPGNVVYKNNLAISSEKLGTLYSNLGEMEKALGYFQEYNRLENELYEKYPDNVEFKNGSAISSERLGTTHYNLGDKEKALAYYQEYNRLEAELYEHSTGDVAIKNNVAISSEKLGTTYGDLGDTEKALTYYQEYNRLENELYAAYPGNVEFKHNLAISCLRLGSTYRELDDLDQSLAYYQEYNRLERELYDAYPSNVTFKNSLALSYQWLGWTNENLENNEQAREFYVRSKTLLEQLVKDSPLHVEFKKNLDWVEGRLNDL